MRTQELRDTWPCDALVVERMVTMSETETTLSIEDMLDLYEAIEERNRADEERERQRQEQS